MRFSSESYPHKRRFGVRNGECCAAPTALKMMLTLTQPFRAGLMFGGGPPGLEQAYRFAHLLPGKCSKIIHSSIRNYQNKKTLTPLEAEIYELSAQFYYP